MHLGPFLFVANFVRKVGSYFHPHFFRTIFLGEGSRHPDFRSDLFLRICSKSDKLKFYRNQFTSFLFLGPRRLPEAPAAAPWIPPLGL